MSKKPVVLMILDGYGLNKTHEGNAVYEAKKPVMDRLMKECPFCGRSGQRTCCRTSGGTDGKL